MLQGQKLQQAYDDFIINYSIEKGLTQKTINNKKDILGKLFPFLQNQPLNFETCPAYSFYMFENGWNKPNSRVNINDLSLILNTNQRIVVNGLTEEQVFDNVEQLVRSIGVDRDSSFKLVINRNSKQLKLALCTA